MSHARTVSLLSLLVGLGLPTRAPPASAQATSDAGVSLEPDAVVADAGPDAAEPAEATTEPRAVAAEPRDAVDPGPPMTGERAPAIGQASPPTQIEQRRPRSRTATGSHLRRSAQEQPARRQVLTGPQLRFFGASGAATRRDLRTLGPNTTLVLVNGHRVVQTGAGADLHWIPVSLVDRVETVAGGMSAVYGADAVAGAVNILTRNDVDGVSVELGGASTTAFDQHSHDVTLLAGSQGGRTRITSALGFSYQSPIEAEDRDFTKNGRNVSNNGQPSSYQRLFSMYHASGGETGEKDGWRPVGTLVDPACGIALQSAVTQEPNAGTSYCTFNQNPFTQLISEDTRTFGYLAVEHDLIEAMELYAQARYSRLDSTRAVPAAFPILGGSINGRTVIPAEHAYNAAGHDGNALGWQGRTLGADYGSQDDSLTSDDIDVAVGLRGDIGSDTGWDWDVYGTWSAARYTTSVTDALRSEVDRALDSCTPVTDPADCFNPFSYGAPNSDAIIERIHGEFTQQNRARLVTGNADVGGPLFALPGGDVATAVGAQVRKESLWGDADRNANLENYLFLIGAPDFAAERDVLAGYGELGFPVVRGVDLQGALRHERDSEVGSNTSYRLGANFSPIETFFEDAPKDGGPGLRATYGTSFRSPTLQQVAGTAVGGAYVSDVFVDPNFPMNPVPKRGYATFRPIRVVAPGEVGNPELTNDSAEHFSVGATWAYEGLNLEFDYWTISYRDMIVLQDYQNLVDEDFEHHDNPNISRDAAEDVTSIDISFINSPKLFTDGLDVGASYTRDYGFGDVFVGVSGSYVLDATLHLFWKRAPIEAAGNRNYDNPLDPMPRLRLTFPVSWSSGVHRAGVTIRYISGYRNDDPARRTDATIAPFVGVDLQYGLTVSNTALGSTKVFIGAIDIFDRGPSPLDAPLGYDPYVHDPKGRSVYARLVQEF